MTPPAAQDTTGTPPASSSIETLRGDADHFKSANIGAPVTTIRDSNIDLDPGVSN